MLTTNFILEFIDPIYINEKDYLDKVLAFPFKALNKPNIINKEFNIDDFNVVKRRMIDEIKSINDNSSKIAITDALKEMDDLISIADFVIATLPETKETINIFNKSFFEKMKKNAVFVNIGRGSSLNEDDLVEVLNENKIKGAVLDVTQNEPIEKDSKLYSISKNKLLLTNHSLGVTKEYPKLGFECVKMNVFSYLENGKPKNVVNKEACY